MKTAKTKNSLWLKEFARRVTSQGGEDGILEKIMDVLPDTDQWCVEFGSWDGKHLSNTYNLIANKNYSAVLIEGDSKRFQDLVANFQSNSRVTPVNRFVGFEKDNCLDRILDKTEIPKNFDLLSIDIDGNDYHVWETVTDYQAKVVIIEFNPTVPKTVEFVQPRDMIVTQGTGLLSMVRLANDKGYELLAVESANAIFVSRQYYELFDMKDNSIDTLWTDQSAITHLFFGYDGTVFLRGLQLSPWQQIPLKEPNVQILPKWARKTFGGQNAILCKLGKMYRRKLKKC